MTKEIYIRFRDGEKEAELQMNSIDKEHQLSVVDGLLKFFDINVDFKGLSDIYHRSAKAYKDFYEEIDTNSDYKDEKLEEEKEPINVEDYVENLKSHNEEIAENKHALTSYNSEPEYFTTGIKHDTINQPLYKCRYKCKCGHEGNHYIKIGSKTVYCWQRNCGRTMKVRPATTFGEVQKDKNPELFRDSKGNFFVAGDFEPEIITLDDIEKEME